MNINHRNIFFHNVAQTSPSPLGLEIVKAEGIYLTDVGGKKYVDLISGISVSNLGHCHPKVIAAINEQAKTYMHLMVYGEYVQHPQTQYAKLLTSLLPSNLNCIYYTNSGTEATEGALKLAKRVTGRSEMICFKNSYHGSTQGALSVMGNEEYKNNFRPLLPDVKQLEFNHFSQLDQITNKTACVIIEPIQGEAGIHKANTEFLKELRKKCDETCTLLIFDEIQSGFGRTGMLFAFENYNVVPDVLLIAKGMGGGLPIGAFVASEKMMSCLTNNPVLGHITTFGGNAVCVAAAKATLEVLVEEKLYLRADEIEKIIIEMLVHPKIIEVRCVGALCAIEFGDTALNVDIINECIKRGVITDWFLHCPTAMRITPPLIITNKELRASLQIILEVINNT
ncbi:MAG TPA: aspartate aminotransferase family protein [Bacteroidia bacterium]|jgi:acetylornithine/N-succinyldiaminopimelate aminotransferase|nr:aspartate aminotransferase family protein [Bacteroidia bacterium]